MKKEIYAFEAQFLRRLGFTYKEIGKLLSVPTGTAYNLCKKPASYKEKRGNKSRLSERPLLRLWNSTDPEAIARVFYIYLPSWVAERYPRGTVEHSLCYEAMLDRLWRYKRLQKCKNISSFARAAYAYVHRRLFGDFRWASETKKNIEARYMTLEEAGFEDPAPEREE